MIIRKEYNIEELAKNLQKEIKKADQEDKVLRISIITAHNILDVLQETFRREQKNQTLESALTFVEKEDGTQTNLLEEHKEPSCFGSYGNNDTWEVCKECDCEHDCMFATNVRNKMEVKEKEGRANE